jgi:hypothetical protein
MTAGWEHPMLESALSQDDSERAAIAGLVVNKHQDYRFKHPSDR